MKTGWCSQSPEELHCKRLLRSLADTHPVGQGLVLSPQEAVLRGSELGQAPEASRKPGGEAGQTDLQQTANTP